MACILGPIPPAPPQGERSQVVIEYRMSDSETGPSRAFRLDMNGNCWIDVARLKAFAEQPAVLVDTNSVYLARSILAAAGVPVRENNGDWSFYYQAGLLGGGK